MQDFIFWGKHQNPQIENHLKASWNWMIYSLPNHEMDKLTSPTFLALVFWSVSVHMTRPIQPSYPNFEINDVNLGAKCVSKVQRFMLSFKIRPIPVHKKKSIVGPALFLKKINHGSCQWSHYSLDARVPPSHSPLHVDISSIELHFHRLLSWFKIETTFYIPFPS